jgi:hypothetical protein
MWVLGILVGGLILAVLVLTVVASESRYWIGQYDNTFYTDEYEEEDGCVYFINNWNGKDAKVCGNYSITERLSQ